MCGSPIAVVARKCLSCGEFVSSAKSPGKRRYFLSLIEWLIVCMIIAVLTALLLPAVQQASSGGRRDQCKDHLKHIGMALYLYHEDYGSFPPAYIADKNGRPMHSWRVLILPYLGQQQIYDEYRFDEPWDGPHNFKLADRIINEFNCRGNNRGIALPATPMTSYVAVVGQDTAWPGETPAKLVDFADGTDHTLLVVETNNSRIHWMAPRDLQMSQIDPTINSKSSPGISSIHGGAQALFADGHMEFLSNSLPASTIQALLTRSGGEFVGDLWAR